LEVAAEMSGISKEDAQEVADSYFQTLSYLIDDDRIPEIYVQSLGKLEFSKDKVKMAMANKSNFKLSEHEAEFLNTQVPIVENRISREDKRESGIGYWWSFVPKNFVSQLIKNKNDGK
jgi:hypothetical protein